MILVTGATGFVGRRLVAQLVESYGRAEIVCLVHPEFHSPKEKSGRENLTRLGLTVVEADLLTGQGLERLPKSPRMVFHLASCTDTSYPDHSINDVGTRNLVEATGPLGRGTHFIYTSTIAVNDGRSDQSRPMTENVSPVGRPYHIYGRKKLETEQYLIQQAKQQGFALSIVRVCGVLGADAIEKGLYTSLRQLVLNKSILARFNWPGRISCMYVDDMAWFIQEVSKNPPASGTHELYIPSVEAPTVAQMAEAYALAFGMEYRPIKLPAFLWKGLEWITGFKRFWEKVLPHKLYNTVWQANILVGQGYWNESVKLDKIVRNRHLTGFAEFARMVAAQSTKEKT
jgi:nucleoside-diphosphate-sugar epimerase